MNKKQVLEKINSIDTQIRKLRKQKVELLHDNDMIYCRECCKLYKKEKCEQMPIFGNDGCTLKNWSVVCPKGHKWDNMAEAYKPN